MLWQHNFRSIVIASFIKVQLIILNSWDPDDKDRTKALISWKIDTCETRGEQWTHSANVLDTLITICSKSISKSDTELDNWTTLRKFSFVYTSIACLCVYVQKVCLLSKTNTILMHSHATVKTISGDCRKHREIEMENLFYYLKM